MEESAMQGQQDPSEHLYRLNRIYLAIIMRYVSYIEEKESISVAELPTLVTPTNAEIIKKADALKSKFAAYTYENNFFEASMAAFEFVRDKIEYVSLPLQFWLMPEETLQFMAGDIIDKNVLLCSLIISLGNPSAKVLIKIQNELRKVITYYEFNNRIYVLNVEDGISEYDSRNSMIESMHADDDSVAYEFNDKMYIDIM
ncbi:MAG: hypothetical protein M1128_03435 [Candidatus Marsarchaeota archaeon]|nr:hypothetical protein [Candidatus Marsarchaeota archaeon]